MSPRFVLGRENVPCVAEVVNRLLKADCTDFTHDIPRCTHGISPMYRTVTEFEQCSEPDDSGFYLLHIRELKHQDAVMRRRRSFGKFLFI